MRTIFFILLFEIAVFSNFLSSQVFPETLIEEEKSFLIQGYGKPGESLKNAWANYLRSKILDATRQKAQTQAKVNYALPEFGKVEGVCFVWKYDFASLKDLIKEVASDSKAYIAVSKEDGEIASILKEYGCNMKNVEVFQVDADTIWVQDYGPFFVCTSDGKREVVDLVYNRPRPKDDDFPRQMAATYKWQVRPSNLVLPGGNLILDGCGAAIVSDAIFNLEHGGDPNLTLDLLKAQMKEHFNCHEVHILKSMKKDGTGHVDMFCKLLDTRNVIVGEYLKKEDAADTNYEILNENAEKLARLCNGKGERFIVHRILMPPYDKTAFTYTNSLIVNDKVLVPTYGCKEDEAALQVYRKILPHAKVIGFDCNEIIGLNGAIHCMTKPILGIPSVVSRNSIPAIETLESKTKKSQR